MGQCEIIQFLRANKGKTFTSKQLGKHFGISHNSMATCLRALRKAKLVKYIESQNAFTKAYIYWL